MSGDAARLRLKVRHYEVDAYGHVNHAVYVHYLETARVEALEAIGLPLPEMQRQGFLIVAVALSLRYHAPAHPGETLEITTHVQEIRGARSIWAQEIREVTSGRLLVTAEVTGAFVQPDGRPLRIRPEFRTKLERLRHSGAAGAGGASPAQGASSAPVASSGRGEPSGTSPAPGPRGASDEEEIAAPAPEAPRRPTWRSS